MVSYDDENEEIHEELVEQEKMAQFFAYFHLPEHLQKTSKPFWELMASLVKTVPKNAERTVALRKLLEAKDAAERAVVYP